MTDGFSPAALRGFEFFFLPWLHRRLSGILITGVPSWLPPVPVLLAANHTSWWDPFLLREVHRRLRPAAPIYNVMLHDELERRPFFKRIGAIGIEPGSASSTARAIGTLRSRLAARPDAILSFFPQGAIWPARRRPLGFQPGIRLFARRLAPITVVPVSIHIEPLTRPAPVAFVALGEPILPGSCAPDACLLEARVSEGLDWIHELLDRHGEGAVDRWPELWGAGRPMRDPVSP